MKNTNLLKKHLSKCRVIHLWLDEERFNRNPSPSKKIAEKVKSIGNFGLFVGVLRWYKGLHVLLSAMKKISYHVIIVGRGPLFPELDKRIKKEKLNNVHLMGFLDDDDVQYLLKKTQFTVLPSISSAEAFGQILIESMFFKKACISTSLGTGTDFVNLDGESGLVVKPNDPDLLSSAMKKLFENPNLTKKMGLNGYYRYQKYFSKNSQSKKYINIYKELVS